MALENLADAHKDWQSLRLPETRRKKGSRFYPEKCFPGYSLLDNLGRGRSGISEATVVKFCQRLGYSGYQEFKITLAPNRKEAEVEEIYDEIGQEDYSRTIIDKIFQFYEGSFADTKKLFAGAGKTCLFPRRTWRITGNWAKMNWKNTIPEDIPEFSEDEQVVFCSYSAGKDPAQINLIQKIARKSSNFAVTGLSSPYDARIAPPEPVLYTSPYGTTPRPQQGTGAP